MSVSTSDESLTALAGSRDDLLAWSAADLNEADTRAKVVDRVFKSVLGWEESAIQREVRTADAEYLDYLFESPSNRFVVEAKRAGTYFEMPAGASLRARRDGILTKSPSLHYALQQAVGYCQSKGIPVGVVSNGLQIAVTLIYKPKDSGGYDTLIFDGLEPITSNYIMFWNLLAPCGDAQTQLESLLQSKGYLRPAPQFAERVLEVVHLPNEVISRNPVDAALAPVIRHYFSDLTDESRADVLRQAYVESGRQAQYQGQLDALLADRAPKLGLPVETIDTKRRGADAIDRTLDEGITNLELSPDSTVYLLVGGVGAGKTTFVHRYFRFLMEETLRDRVLFVIVDLTHTSEDNPDLSGFMDTEVLRQIEQRYPEFDIESWSTLEQIYEHDIARLRRGILAPYFRTDPDRFQQLVSDELRRAIESTERHVQSVIRYLRMRCSKLVCVVFDNADQLGQEFQHRALIRAFQKSRVWGTIGLLSLREETYWRFRNTPPFDAYHRYVHHIAAPRIANVLSRRLELAKKEMGAQVISVQSRTGLDFVNIALGRFLEILVDSFLGEDQRNIVLLEALSANDVRHALDMFATFLTSGHTNTDEYIKTYALSGSYIVPFHHVLRSIALAEWRYYDSARSLIENMFSIEDDGFYSHFQKVRILRYLHGVRQIETAPGRGFVEVGRLFQAFSALVSDEEGMRRILDRLLRQRLIEAANGYRVRGEAADSVRITSAGYYYLSTLLEQFAYLDLVTTDTPIKSREWYEKIKQVASADGALLQGIKERLDKVGVFLEYLAAEEDAEVEYVQRAGLPALVTSPIVAPLRERFATARQDILESAQRSGRDRPRLA